LMVIGSLQLIELSDAAEAAPLVVVRHRRA
jgi:hypothetical protein